MTKKDKKFEDDDDLDDLLDNTFELQDRIHPRCKISNNATERQKRWNEKYKKD
ncbi:MAG: hypothetical protein ACFFDK_01315 [Promethearchaeota archaeon]